MIKGYDESDEDADGSVAGAAGAGGVGGGGGGSDGGGGDGGVGGGAFEIVIGDTSYSDPKATDKRGSAVHEIVLDLDRYTRYSRYIRHLSKSKQPID